ncbi:MAG TPA: cyclase family protein [Patescibacteria group bacterium]|nr:cyclase family protein [Patescibacteria group bacterium]
MKYYDITIPISEATPEWPGDTAYRREERQTSAIVSKITMSSHFGTHVDAPRHFLFHKASVDKLALEKLTGKFRVAESKAFPLIPLSDVQKLNVKPGDKILFKTRNARLNTKPQFTADYASLSLEAAKYLAAKKIALVGIDYFGIEAKSAPGHPVHLALLSKGVVVVEGLNLNAVKPGTYQGAILPMKITGGDGAPARAVLWKQ